MAEPKWQVSGPKRRFASCSSSAFCRRSCSRGRAQERSRRGQPLATPRARRLGQQTIAEVRELQVVAVAQERPGVAADAEAGRARRGAGQAHERRAVGAAQPGLVGGLGRHHPPQEGHPLHVTAADVQQHAWALVADGLERDAAGRTADPQQRLRLRQGEGLRWRQRVFELPQHLVG